MTALPRALARWEAELAWLEPALVSAMGAMLPRIALAVGPLARSKEPTGEPDGYGRIARRGPFDRMLASQWALLDEVPEEFLRRAFSNELLFHELARAEPKGSQRSVALFDAGPGSLGAPRIAHLAILVVLARRAAEVGVPFSWGTLREPLLRTFVGETSVRALLASRTPFAATEAALDAWSAQLWERAGSAPESGERARRDDDVWVIGDCATLVDVRARWGARAALACVEEPLALSATELSLTVTRAPRSPRVVALPLPEARDRVRLVRDPFRAPPPAAPPRAVPSDARAPVRAALHVELARGTDVVFSRDGRKVIARTARGGVVAVALPDVGHPGRVLSRAIGERERLVAAGTTGRRLVAVTETGDAPSFQVTELLGGARDLDSVELPKPQGQYGLGERQLRPLYVGTLSHASRPLDVAVHTGRELLVWSAVRERARVHPASLVVPIGSGTQGLVLAHRSGERASETTPLDELMARPGVQGAQHAPAVAAHIVGQLALCLDARRGTRPHGGVRPALVHVASHGRLSLAEPDPPVDLGSGPVGADARLAYLSPEQTLGEPVDERTDVYALGLLLHELLAGVHPAPGGTTFERIDAIRRGRLADLAMQRPGIAPELHAIVRTATARDVRQRFAAVGVLRDALDRYRASLHVAVGDDEIVDALRLDEIPTRHLAPTSAWELVALRDPTSSPVPLAHSLSGTTQLRVGGTAGGVGLFVAVEPERARIFAPTGHGEVVLAKEPEHEVIGAAGINRMAVRLGDVIEIRDPTGRCGALELPGLSRVVMAPGWPHAAAVLSDGSIHVLSLYERRTLLVIGGTS